MKKVKLITAVLLVLVMALGALAGCGNQTASNEVDENGKYTYTVTLVNPKENIKEDALYKQITEKFNVDFDVLAITYDNWTEKNRIWLSSGDMPDAIKWAFNFEDYQTFSKQGVIKQLPDDFETKYPNIAAQMINNKTLDKLKSINDGKVYTFIPSYGFGNKKYEEGFDVNVDMYAFAYRKDWAEQLGIETAPLMAYEDVMDMARKFKEADLGNVGADNTVGIAVHYTEAPNIFVTAFNSSYNMFHKDENGKYTYGMLEASTYDGVKEYTKAYKEGILSPNFFAHKSDNLKSMFVTGKTGLYYNNFSGNNAFANLKKTFKQSNPSLNPDEVLGLCWFTSPDGKVHGRENTDFWENTYYNPKMSDEKFEKLLTVMDYIAGNDGALFKAYGIEGVDYAIEGDAVKRLIDPREDGSYNMKELYPSIGLFGGLVSSSFSDSKYIPTDETDAHSIKTLNDLGLAKLGGERAFANIDLDFEFYTSDELSKFMASTDINSLILDVVMADDPEATWNAKIAEIKDSAKAIEEELNNAIGK